MIGLVPGALLITSYRDSVKTHLILHVKGLCIAVLRSNDLIDKGIIEIAHCSDQTDQCWFVSNSESYNFKIISPT